MLKRKKDEKRGKKENGRRLSVEARKRQDRRSRREKKRKTKKRKEERLERGNETDV